MTELRPYRVADDEELSTPEAASHQYFQWIDRRDIEDQGARVLTVDRRTPVSVLAIPGFGMDSRQFLREQNILAEIGINSLSITLQGNGPFAGSNTRVSYRDWLESARNALSLAAALGDKVVVMGQSTGAEIGLSLALESPSLVQGLIFSDPAFKMRRYLQWSTCAGKGLISDARNLGFLANLYRSDATTLPNPVSLNMACEVSRLDKDVVQRFGGPSLGAANGASAANDPYLNLFRKIQVPTLLSYTTVDTVIDPAIVTKMAEVNPKEFTAYDWHRLGSTSDERNAGHGQIAQEEILSHGLLESFMLSRMGISSESMRKSMLAMGIRNAYNRFEGNLPRVARCLKAAAGVETNNESPLSGEVLDVLSFCPAAKSLDDGLGMACRFFNPGMDPCDFLDGRFSILQRLSNLAEEAKLHRASEKAGEIRALARQLVASPGFAAAMRAAQEDAYVGAQNSGPDLSSLPDSRLTEVCRKLPYEFSHFCDTQFR